MTTPKTTLWPADAHTLAKHDILQRYLGAWFPILASGNSKILYIDGFCGPGRYEGGEAGSPIVAIRSALVHSDRLRYNRLTFLFTDEDEQRVDHLKQELQGWRLPNNFQIDLAAGKFSTTLSNLLDRLEAENLRLEPTFAFIDPFGWDGLPFNLIRRLLANPKTEVFINFMVDAMNRHLENPNHKIRQQISELFGTADFANIPSNSTSRIESLRNLYQTQLQGCAKFIRYFEMRNDQGRIIYYLFFAGNHALGHIRMKEALWKVDPESGYIFSDATNPNQAVLFNMDWGPTLAESIHAKFQGRTVPVNTVKQFVEDETAFLAKHMRDALRRLEGDSRITVEPFKTDKTKRRNNTYPDEAVIVFSSVSQ